MTMTADMEPMGFSLEAAVALSGASSRYGKSDRVQVDLVISRPLNCFKH